MPKSIEELKVDMEAEGITDLDEICRRVRKMIWSKEGMELLFGQPRDLFGRPVGHPDYIDVKELNRLADKALKR